MSLSGRVGYEELSRSRRVLSTEAEGLSMISIIEQFSDFLGDYRAFFREKWRIKVEHSDWGNKSIMYKGLIISHVNLKIAMATFSTSAVPRWRRGFKML